MNQEMKTVSIKPSDVVVHPLGRMNGLGDLVHLAANPIAKIADKVLHTSLSSCNACAKRREALNNAVPFKAKSLIDK